MDPRTLVPYSKSQDADRPEPHCPRGPLLWAYQVGIDCSGGVPHQHPTHLLSPRLTAMLRVPMQAQPRGRQVRGRG